MVRATTFNDILRAIGIRPETTKLYRHAGEEGRAEWAKGRARFLSYVTYQNAAARIFTDRVTHCAHFLAEQGASGPVGLFIGVSAVMGPTRRFDEANPVEGYIPGSAYPKASSDEGRVATPLRWVKAEGLQALVGYTRIDWGPGARAKAQWAHRHDKAVLSGCPSAGAGQSLPAAPANDALGYETRLARIHRVIERRGVDADRIKAMRGLVCEGCGLDAVAAFGRPHARRVIEAHHLTPMGDIAPGDWRKTRVADFRVLCATCHRLIHGLERPDDMDGLRKIVNRVAELKKRLTPGPARRPAQATEQATFLRSLHGWL